MQRNKLIYALADASLVVSSDIDKGGTWAGAVEQLDKLRFVTVYVRSTGESSAGLDALRKRGALPWPNPRGVESFDTALNEAAPMPAVSTKAGFSLFGSDGQADASPTASAPLGTADLALGENEPSVRAVRYMEPAPELPQEPPSATPAPTTPVVEVEEAPQVGSTPADVLFAAVPSQFISSWERP